MAVDLESTNFSVKEICELLSLDLKDAKQTLFKKAKEVKEREVGKTVYYRGLVEYSNICQKDCYYCGIRKSNQNINRYKLETEETIETALLALDYEYGSIVIQAGEIESPRFIDDIEYIVKEIKKRSEGKLGITLSLGEQTEDTYRRWFEAGAHRYLLRIETSSPELYKKIHPNNETHNLEKRIECLKLLRKVGYQVGSGIMVGLPHQSYEDIAKDLLFLRDLDIDMCGLGPFIEHADTPFFEKASELPSLQERYELALKTIAVLRLLMPDINMASATALQAIDPAGREKALEVGTNIIMPSLTPTRFREAYKLYENKPCTDEDASQCRDCLEVRIQMFDHDIGYGKWGDSPRFHKRK